MDIWADCARITLDSVSWEMLWWGVLGAGDVLVIGRPCLRPVMYFTLGTLPVLVTRGIFYLG